LLKSKVSVDNIDSTASLGVVTGAITNASNFKVERYNVAVRGFRYVAAPVTGVTAKTFKDSVIIAGPTAAGFDAPNTSVATIKSFVEWRNPNWSKCFVSFTNINTAIAPGSGYYLFVPAKRTTVFPANAPVSLLMKGTPITGNFNFNLYYTPTASAGWNLLGNPYPSAIDWDNAGAWTKTNVDDAIYIWDPTLGTSGSYYAYVSGISSDARDHGSVISSGQGFFVKANAAAPVLRVTENAKVSSTFAKSNFRQALSCYVTLRVTNQNGDVDYTTIRLNDETGRNLSAVKMYNSKINMYSKKVSGVDAYSINAIDDAPSFEVPIYIESTNSSVYNVEVIKVIGDINATGSLKIKDQVTGTLHDVIVGAKISLIPDGNTQRISLIRQDHVEAVVTTIGDKETDGEYQLYPTHIHGHQHPVLYMHNHHDKKIEVFNTSGERLAVHHTHHAHYAFHDFDKYGSGVYLIKVTSDHKTHTFKVMK
ncbi:MAG TPA: T9SS type A sorting domain-containing protein, partial [Cytophagales bacterium]|nr:T9SS type A sorting domain-containing protein [Cytophagales bacterium]